MSFLGLKHIGQKGYKYQYQIIIHEVDHLPSSSKNVTLVLSVEKSQKHFQTKVSLSDGEKVVFNEAIELNSTLFKKNNMNNNNNNNMNNNMNNSSLHINGLDTNVNPSYFAQKIYIFSLKYQGNDGGGVAGGITAKKKDKIATRDLDLRTEIDISKYADDIQISETREETCIFPLKHKGKGPFTQTTLKLTFRSRYLGLTSEPSINSISHIPSSSHNNPPLPFSHMNNNNTTKNGDRLAAAARNGSAAAAGGITTNRLGRREEEEDEEEIEEYNENNEIDGVGEDDDDMLERYQRRGIGKMNISSPSPLSPLPFSSPRSRQTERKEEEEEEEGNDFDKTMVERILMNSDRKPSKEWKIEDEEQRKQTSSAAVAVTAPSSSKKNELAEKNKYQTPSKQQQQQRNGKRSHDVEEEENDVANPLPSSHSRTSVRIPRGYRSPSSGGITVADVLDQSIAESDIDNDISSTPSSSSHKSFQSPSLLQRRDIKTGGVIAGTAALSSSSSGMNKSASNWGTISKKLTSFSHEDEEEKKKKTDNDSSSSHLSFQRHNSDHSSRSAQPSSSSSSTRSSSAQSLLSSSSSSFSSSSDLSSLSISERKEYEETFKKKWKPAFNHLFQSIFSDYSLNYNNHTHTSSSYSYHTPSSSSSSSSFSSSSSTAAVPSTPLSSKLQNHTHSLDNEEEDDIDEEEEDQKYMRKYPITQQKSIEMMSQKAAKGQLKLQREEQRKKELSVLEKIRRVQTGQSSWEEIEEEERKKEKEKQDKKIYTRTIPTSSRIIDPRDRNKQKKKEEEEEKERIKDKNKMNIHKWYWNGLPISSIALFRVFIQNDIFSSSLPISSSSSSSLSVHKSSSSSRSHIKSSSSSSSSNSELCRTWMLSDFLYHFRNLILSSSSSSSSSHHSSSSHSSSPLHSSSSSLHSSSSSSYIMCICWQLNNLIILHHLTRRYGLLELNKIRDELRIYIRKKKRRNKIKKYNPDATYSDEEEYVEDMKTKYEIDREVEDDLPPIPSFQDAVIIPLPSFPSSPSSSSSSSSFSSSSFFDPLDILRKKPEDEYVYELEYDEWSSNIYIWFIHQICELIQPILHELILYFYQHTYLSKLNIYHILNQEDKFSLGSNILENMLDIWTDIWNTINQAQLMPVICVQLMGVWASWVDELLRDSMLYLSPNIYGEIELIGMRLSMLYSEIIDWGRRINGLNSSLTAILRIKIKPVKELSTLCLYPDKHLLDMSELIRICPSVPPHQLYHILTQYNTCHNNMNDLISPALLHALQTILSGPKTIIPSSSSSSPRNSKKGKERERSNRNISSSSSSSVPTPASWLKNGSNISSSSSSSPTVSVELSTNLGPFVLSAVTLPDILTSHPAFSFLNNKEETLVL